MITHEKLLPCPFCGGEAHLFDGNWVECTKCGCQTPETFEEVVISAWNRRTPPAAVPDGRVMVPRDPTPKMLDAATPPASEWIGHPEAKPESIERWRQGHREDAERKYRSMISAAPAAPTEGSDE